MPYAGIGKQILSFGKQKSQNTAWWIIPVKEKEALKIIMHRSNLCTLHKMLEIIIPVLLAAIYPDEISVTFNLLLKRKILAA